MQFFRFFCFRPFIMHFLLKKSIWDFQTACRLYKQFTRRDLKPLTFLVLSYLQPFAVVVLQNSCSSKKTTMSESLFNQPAVCYVFDKNLQYKPFLVNFVKLLRTQFFSELLRTLAFVFMEIISNIKNPNDNQLERISSLLRHSLIFKCIRVKSKLGANVRIYSLSSLLIP